MPYVGRRATIFRALSENRPGKDEPRQWLIERYGTTMLINAQGQWTHTVWEENIYGIIIYDEDAAMEFKLRWG
ncbi:MAG: hypothetical protein EOO77_29635 [Oxalobacteraceae bacterium]|nr:MAG: hypothetical protein EOO77_29635 [Oxalobacteraceae bacterium]